MAAVIPLDTVPAALRTAELPRKKKGSTDLTADQAFQDGRQRLPFPLLSPSRQQTFMYRALRRTNYASFFHQKSPLSPTTTTSSTPVQYTCERTGGRPPNGPCSRLRARLCLPALSFSRGLQHTGPVRIIWPDHLSITGAQRPKNDVRHKVIRSKSEVRIPRNNPRSRCLSSTYKRLSAAALSLRREQLKKKENIDHAPTTPVPAVPSHERHVTFVEITYRSKSPSGMFEGPRGISGEEPAPVNDARESNSTAVIGDTTAASNLSDKVSSSSDYDQRHPKKLPPVTNRAPCKQDETEVSMNSRGRALPTIKRRRRKTYPNSVEQLGSLPLNRLDKSDAIAGWSTSFTELNTAGISDISPRGVGWEDWRHRSLPELHHNPSKESSDEVSQEHSLDVIPSMLQQGRLKQLEPLRQTDRRKRLKAPKRLKEARSREPISGTDIQDTNQDTPRSKPLELAKLDFNRGRNRSIVRAAHSVGLTAEEANDLYYTRDSKILSNMYIEKLNKLAFGSDSDSDGSDD